MSLPLHPHRGSQPRQIDIHRGRTTAAHPLQTQAEPPSPTRPSPSSKTSPPPSKKHQTPSPFPSPPSSTKAPKTPAPQSPTSDPTPKPPQMTGSEPDLPAKIATRALGPDRPRVALASAHHPIFKPSPSAPARGLQAKHTPSTPAVSTAYVPMMTAVPVGADPAALIVPRAKGAMSRQLGVVSSPRIFGGGRWRIREGCR